MPELPEVETIKEDLRELVVGSAVERAEHLIVERDSGDALVSQLKIGGQLLLVPPVEEPRTAVMFILHLDGGRRLFLRDQTGFTRARLLDAGELEARLSPLGPEPLEEGFAVEYLRETLGGRRAQIKPLILDQKVVAGVGNIYADEILFDARLHPRRKANTLSEAEWRTLYEAIRENLAAGVEHRGTTVRLYRDVLNRPGEHQNYLRVFEKHGLPCPEGCGGEVVRESVGGRPTHYCPEFQRLSGGGGEQRLTF